MWNDRDVPVKVHVDDDVAVLRMEEPRGNALSFACIAAMNDAFDQVERAGARALVLTGKGGVFSVGLDLQEAHAFDRPTFVRYVEAFEALFLRTFLLPFPVVAAVNGHAVAGGCVLALSCDAQLLARGSYGFGVNEVMLGIPFPSCAFEVSRYGVPRAAWNEVFLEGRRMTPDEAYAAGIVEAVVDDPIAAAQAKARKMIGGGARALAIVKQDLKREHAERARTRADESRAAFVDAWFADEARARIAAVLDELRARTKPSG